MSIDLNSLSAKELDALINQAKKRKTTLTKRKPLAAVRQKLTALARAEGLPNMNVGNDCHIERAILDEVDAVLAGDFHDTLRLIVLRVRVRRRSPARRTN